MNELTLLGGIFLVALASAFVPLVSIELALVVSAAAGTSGASLAALVAAAAAGQMVGKSCFFLGGRSAFAWCGRRRERRPGRRMGKVVRHAAQSRSVAVGTVLVSATTGIPPFALVSAAAGGWRLRLSSFFVMGFAGRSARFATVLLAPGLVGLL